MTNPRKTIMLDLQKSPFIQSNDIMFANEDEEILFADETDELDSQGSWKILIVDDETEVHDVTKLALSEFVLEGKSLSFLSAYSGQEAKGIIQENPDLAIIFIDVVMETEQAGLDLVKYIREEIKNPFIRIILRTGQPGQAPEKSVVLNYGIDDYKTKTELTSQRLFISVVTALRAFSTLMETLEGRHQLEIEIAHRQQAEAALQENYYLLNSLFEALPDFVFVKDLQGRHVFLNSNFAQFVGYSSVQDVIGKNSDELFSSSMAESIKAKDQEVMAQGCSSTFEEVIVHRELTQTYLTTKAPWQDSQGQVIGLIGVARDISNRKIAEEALRQSELKLRQRTAELEKTLQDLGRAQAKLVQSEKMSSLGQLVAGVAHEINNPVNFILGNLSYASEYTQGLLEVVQAYQTHCQHCSHPQIQAKIDDLDLEFVSEDLPNLLQSMQIGAERIQEIVASLRIFSRLDESEVKGVDIHQGIDSTLMILQHRLKARADRPAIQIVKDYSQLPLIECYAGQLNQVFMNLMSNAIDAFDDLNQNRSYQDIQAAPNVISIRTFLSERDSVCIQIRDNGPGIPENIQPRLFDPFFTTKAVGKGTGMGLAISYQIITERHGGQLSFTSSSQQGTEFMIKIPVHQTACPIEA